MDTSLVNSAFHAPLYAGSEVISKYYCLRTAQKTKLRVNNLICDYYMIY